MRLEGVRLRGGEFRVRAIWDDNFLFDLTSTPLEPDPCFAGNAFSNITRLELTRIRDAINRVLAASAETRLPPFDGVEAAQQGRSL